MTSVTLAVFAFRTTKTFLFGSRRINTKKSGVSEANEFRSAFEVYLLYSFQLVKANCYTSFFFLLFLFCIVVVVCYDCPCKYNKCYLSNKLYLLHFIEFVRYVFCIVSLLIASLPTNRFRRWIENTVIMMLHCWLSF